MFQIDYLQYVLEQHFSSFSVLLPTPPSNPGYPVMMQILILVGLR